MNVLVIGASRGIGLELVRQYRAESQAVTATARSDEALGRLRALGAAAIKLDVADAASASGLAWAIDGAAFEVVLIAAGVYGPRSAGLDAPTETDFDHVMHTNVLGPMRVVSQLGSALAPGAKLAVLSSRMGAIGSRSGASGWLYRASKAALNSVLKDTSLVLKGKATCVALHPGWVRTDMGGPAADLDASQSAAEICRTLAGLKSSDNGRFFNHDGAPLAW